MFLNLRVIIQMFVFTNISHLFTNTCRLLRHAIVLVLQTLLQSLTLLPQNFKSNWKKPYAPCKSISFFLTHCSHVVVFSQQFVIAFLYSCYLHNLASHPTVTGKIYCSNSSIYYTNSNVTVMSHFRMVVSIPIKARLGTHLFMWKLVSFAWKEK